MRRIGAQDDLSGIPGASASLSRNDVASLFGVSLSTFTRWAGTGRSKEALMNAVIVRSQRFLDRPLGLGSRALLVLSAVLIFPWHLGPFGGEIALAPASWISFALGALALLFLRASVHGKVRDLVDVAVIAVYFSLFLLWTSQSGSGLYLLLIVALLMGVAFVKAWGRASSEDIAEIQSAG